jgi:DNA-binding GntR family transcriptional regulator
MNVPDISNRFRLRQQIFDFLYAQIEKGTLAPGSTINVKQLTQELNVSRTPLREALAQLEIQGLVTIRPQRGVVINALTYEELVDIFEILGALESQALASVFDRIDDQIVNAMDKCNHEMALAVKNEQSKQFHEKNIQLHSLFLDLSNNSVLKTTVSNLKMRLFGFAIKRYRKRFKEAIVLEHDMFIDMLRSGQKEQAISFLKEVHWKFNYPENFIQGGSDN